MHTWRSEKLAAVLTYRGVKNSPQGIESTRSHWEHMLSFRVYDPAALDASCNEELGTLTTIIHYDWMAEYKMDRWEGEMGEETLAYVRWRTYGMLQKSSIQDLMVGSRLMYYSTSATGGRFHHVRMLVDPLDSARWNPHRTQLVHCVFALKVSERPRLMSGVVGIHLLHWQDTWCGEATVDTVAHGTHHAFWRIVPDSQLRDPDHVAKSVELDASGKCVCYVAFDFNILIRHGSITILVRILPWCTVTKRDDLFRVETHTTIWEFASPLRYYEEPPDARLVLDPFFASPFSQWLVFCLNHCLRWRLDHVDASSSRRFVSDFLALSRQYKGDELQHRLQQTFPLQQMGGVVNDSVPLVATNPPFFFRRNMFDQLFRARDVVVLCSETDRTVEIMDSLDMRKMDAPMPKGSFVFYKNGKVTTSHPNVRKALRYWVKKANQVPVGGGLVVAPFDALLNQLLIVAIVKDGIGQFDGDTLQRPDKRAIDDIKRMEEKGLGSLLAALMQDSTRTKRVYKLAALYFVRLRGPDVVASLVDGAVWADVRMIASHYWNTIDTVIEQFPELVRTHYLTITKQPEALRTRSLLFFTLGTPHIEEIEAFIASPDEVDSSLYAPIRRWYSCLDEVNNWLGDALTTDEQKALVKGIVKLQLS